MEREQQSWMEKAVKIALENVLQSHGGPFGAIVVKGGQIVGTGSNQVTATNDPTAHAEVQAIREACRNLGTFQLTDCELYTSCEPCPMCLGAIYWARPKIVYFASTKQDAAKIGFDDQFIYEQIGIPYENRSIPFLQIHSENYLAPFEAWGEAQNKVEY